jgi:hypothetical protein
LELLTDKLVSVVIYSSGWPWVAAQPFTVEEEGNMGIGFVPDGNKFQPTCGFVNDG